MAWNTPGNKGGDGPDPNRRRSWGPRGGGNGGGWGNLPAPLKELFDGGVWRWVLIAVVLMVLFSSFQLIGEQQRGVVLRFGQFSRILQPGPSFKLPWPIESVRKVNATEIKTFSNQVPVLTRDENIVNVSLNVQYQISDPRKYLFGSRNADLVLEQAAQSAVREQVGRSDLNTVLNNRGPLAIASKDRLQAALNAYNTGLSVTGVTLPDARPPEEVKPAFDEVNGAQQVRERLINEAQAYAAKVVPEARGQGARTRTGAEGYKQAVISKAQGDADRFTLLQEQYADAPDVTRKRLWLETVQKVLSENRKVIGSDGRQVIYVPLPADAGKSGNAGTATGNGSIPSMVPQDVLLNPPQGNGGSAEGIRNPERGPRPTGREGTE
ncbi:FtsH protease activity modulator HflK [Xanthomonas campestris pv. campestris]|uniref:FtsH protease activity modulator HflK n=1 Tax=Xanthomonas campestris TaxID=339 RepID=UPI000E32A40F|nr:FtsH protease activity modulator HflK [Xanthomonas campestris]MEA9576253.1 FtsH protease activity modulator HflK [Xanthomonas campestris]MEA9733131.1 FtsH protease activity modulator HflK [Xanthomonas campestris]RFF71634.1 FtsH protease activity modulator HflK [Xanthomonas campestris pv. campestris]WDJ86199.1 FtsH protease activity modulator HflK [Xanthomonas campestris pv. incanae]WDK24705.1 FtsH protease activity modulator HflK [Xanthomonas campestris pv. incanae]